MSNKHETSIPEIDSKYINVVRDPVMRSAALELAVGALVPLWKKARIDVDAQIEKQKGVNNQIVDAYTSAQQEGDTAAARTHELHLAHVVQIADEFYGQKVDIVEKVSKNPDREQIFAYSADE